MSINKKIDAHEEDITPVSRNIGRGFLLPVLTQPHRFDRVYKKG